MTNEELNTALYKKMSAEQEKFKEWLLAQPPEDILDHSYEYAAREDLLLSLEYNDLSDELAQAMLDSDMPLKEAFSAFEQRETGYMDEVFSCIESAAASLIREKQLADRTPLYRESATYAHEHGELDAYRASHKANVACREAIENAIRDNYRDNRLDLSCVKPIMDRFGVDRVEYVLANTVQYKDWDERFSLSNREWAKTIPIVTDGNDFVGPHCICCGSEPFRAHGYVCHSLSQRGEAGRTDTGNTETRFCPRHAGSVCPCTKSEQTS